MPGQIAQSLQKGGSDGRITAPMVEGMIPDGVMLYYLFEAGTERLFPAMVLGGVDADFGQVKVPRSERRPPPRR